MIAEHAPVLVFAIPLAAALLVAIAALSRARLAHAIATAATIATAANCWSLLARVAAGGPHHYELAGWSPPWGIELAVDVAGAFTASVVASVAALALWWGRRSASLELGSRAPLFYVTTQLALCGLLGMCVTGDAFNLFVFLELASLAGYALVGSGSARSQLAAFRYLMLGATGASLYLLGVGYLYVATGTLNLAELAVRIDGAPLAPIALAFLVAGLALKMGLFPLHGWVPDAYGEAPTPVVAFVAPIFTKVMALAMLRIVVGVFAGHDSVGPIAVGDLIAWAGAAAAIAGAATAASQTALRRLLAWSSIGHIGYIAIGIGIGSELAVAAALLHFMNHALTKGAMFWAVGASGARTVAELRGLWQRSPAAAACLLVAALSLLGAPPLAGFFSKWYLLLAAIDAGRPELAAAVALGSLLSLFYVFRLVEVIVLDTPAAEPKPRQPDAANAPLIVATAAIVAVGPASATMVSHWLLGGLA